MQNKAQQSKIPLSSQTVKFPPHGNLRVSITLPTSIYEHRRHCSKHQHNL